MPLDLNCAGDGSFWNRCRSFDDNALICVALYWKRQLSSTTAHGSLQQAFGCPLPSEPKISGSANAPVTINTKDLR